MRNLRQYPLSAEEKIAALEETASSLLNGEIAPGDTRAAALREAARDVRVLQRLRLSHPEAVAEAEKQETL